MAESKYTSKKLRITKELYDKLDDYLTVSINNIKMVFYKRLKNLRKEYGITQIELAKKLGISSVAISLYESGKRLPQPEILNEIANYFNVSTEYLLGETDKRYEKNKKNKNRKFNFQTDLIREVWKNYLDNEFKLKGYFHIIGKTINTSDMSEEIQVIFPDEQLKKDIEKHLEKLKIQYRDKGKEFYNFTYVTAELLERFLKGK